MRNGAGKGVQEKERQGGWYALFTRHQHEKAVEALLSRKGFETFLPLYSALRSWRDRNKIISLPLYPNYVFLHGGLDRRLAILGTPGVIGLVEFAGRASPIPKAEIEVIRRVIDSRMNVDPHPFLKCGDWVRVKSGPLEGIEGILVRKKSVHRLVLSVDLLQKSVSVEVGTAVVERAARGNQPFLASCVSEPLFGLVNS